MTRTKSSSNPTPVNTQPTRISYRDWLAGIATQAWIPILAARMMELDVTDAEHVAARDAAKLAVYTADRLLDEVDKEAGDGEEAR